MSLFVVVLLVAVALYYWVIYIEDPIQIERMRQAKREIGRPTASR